MGKPALCQRELKLAMPEKWELPSGAFGDSAGPS